MSIRAVAQTTVKWTSYTDYLADMLAEWPEYERLHRFLKEPEPTGPGSASFVTIIDYSNDGRCTSQDHSHSSPQWQSALQKFPDDTATRLLLISFSGTAVSRAIIDKIGLLYDVDPMFFCAHLGCAAPSNKDGEEDGSDNDFQNMVPQAPRSKLLTQIGFGRPINASVSSYTAHDHDPRTPTTVLILLSEQTPYIVGSPRTRRDLYSLLFDRPSSRRSVGQTRLGKIPIIHFRLREVLLISHESKKKQIAQHPMAVILPLLELYLADRADFLKDNLDGLEKEIERELAALEDFRFHMHVYDYIFRYEKKYLTKTLRSLQSVYQVRKQEAWAVDLHVQMSDLTNLLEQIEEATTELDRYRTRWTGERALQDSRKSVAQAESVGRLTVLAFIFIPLSFVTSFFGMNVSELGSGPTGFRVVGLATLAMVLLMLLAWALSKMVGPRLQEARIRFRMFRRTFRFFRIMAVVSPRRAFWMLCFSICHQDEVYELLLVYAGFKNVGRPESEWEQPPRILVETTILDEVLSPFWKSKAMELCEITAIPGWWKYNVFSIRRVKKVSAPSTSRTAAVHPAIDGD